jgi:hypothetical protein
MIHEKDILCCPLCKTVIEELHIGYSVYHTCPEEFWFIKKMTVDDGQPKSVYNYKVNKDIEVIEQGEEVDD